MFHTWQPSFSPFLFTSSAKTYRGLDFDDDVVNCALKTEANFMVTRASIASIWWAYISSIYVDILGYLIYWYMGWTVGLTDGDLWLIA